MGYLYVLNACIHQLKKENAWHHFLIGEIIPNHFLESKSCYILQKYDSSALG